MYTVGTEKITQYVHNGDTVYENMRRLFGGVVPLYNGDIVGNTIG